MNLTYLELLARLQQMPLERLADTVTIFDCEDEEFFPVKTVEITDERCDELDPGHLVLIIKHNY